MQFITKCVNLVTAMKKFDMSSKPDEQKTINKFDIQPIEEQWLAMDEFLPDSNISEEEIMEEVRAVRYPQSTSHKAQPAGHPGQQKRQSACR